MTADGGERDRGGECRSRTCPTFRSRRVSTAMPCRSANSPKRTAGRRVVGEAGIEPAACGVRTRRAANCATPQIRDGPCPSCELIADVIIPLAAVEAAGAQATLFETAAPSRTGTGRCGRASRSALCRRARRDRRAAPAFPRHNPRLRLYDVSKGRQLVEVVAAHGTLLWFAFEQNGQGGRI